MKADSIDQLLEAERGRKGFSQEQRAGLWKGIESSIGPILDPQTPPEKPSPPDAPPNAAPNAAPSVATPLASLKIGALLAVAAIGGAGIGAAAHARWGEPRVVVVERITESALAPAPSAASVATAAPVTPAAPAAIAASALPAVATNRATEPRVAASASVSTAASGSASISTSPARDPGLARERTLLDMARTALSRGDTSAALSAVDNHSREFPKSQLTEEREVLAIQALASAGRLPEARRRGAAFRTSFPKSSLLPIVDESTQ